jgi:hypothetical protein
MTPALTLTRDELVNLTSYHQPARMQAWLLARGWVFEPAQRRGDVPRVDRAYYEACIKSGSARPFEVPPRITAEEWEAGLGIEPREPRTWHTPARLEHLQALRDERERRDAGIAIAAELAALGPSPEHRRGIVRFHAAKRRAAKLRRTPGWADMDAIKAIYQRARALTVRTGVEHHVDHDLPLQGRLVSGLHVHQNLQIITGRENSRKRNRFDPC